MNPTRNRTNLNATAIDDLTVADLAAMSAGALAALDEELGQHTATLNARKAKLDAALQRRYEPPADPGTTHRTEDDYDITITVPKTVDWSDQDLRKILDELPPEEAAHYAKLKITIEERKFTAAPPAIQQLFAKARTVKPGKPRFAFKRLEEEAA